MRNSYRFAFAGVLLLSMPVAANAKSYNGDGNRARHHSANRSVSEGSGGTSRSCLTSEARDILNRIEKRFGHVEIVSTCRPGAKIATSGRPSKHASGQAIDFRVSGRKSEVVKWLIANHSDGGTMTYNDMDHIHVDVGSHFVALNRPSGH